MITVENEQFVIERLSRIKQTPPRNVEKAASARAQFLSDIKTLSESESVVLPVSQSHRQRLNGWIRNIRNLSLRKERYSMLTTLATIMTVITLAFGGAGATVYAAQDSLPGDLLYPVKIASEEFRMNISTETQSQFQLLLEFTNRRMGEIVSLSSNGEVIPQKLMTQLQTEFQNAFQLAAGMSDTEMTPALLKIQATIRQHQQTMASLSSGSNDPLLARIRTMLQVQEQLCELGLTDPLIFRLQVRQRQNNEQTPPAGQPTSAGTNNSQGNQGQGTGVSAGTGLNTNTGTTIGPGANSGPGSQNCIECVPVQDGTGQGPDAGNGEGSENSTPSQDGTGIGAGPNEDPGSGGNTNTDPGNGNNQPEQEETDNGNSDNGNSNPDNPTTPDIGGSEDNGGGKGKP